MNQEKMDCMHSDIHGAGQILAQPFCFRGRILPFAHFCGAVIRPQATHTGEVVGLEHLPCEVRAGEGTVQGDLKQIPSTTDLCLQL